MTCVCFWQNQKKFGTVQKKHSKAGGAIQVYENKVKVSRASTIKVGYAFVFALDYNITIQTTMETKSL